ncbi:MAG: type II toxin-antitoxin system RelE/ParE family toxin [Candidatus Nomurabacteria bacterium]|jgi:plasmid stabilization system protein ParE|nr:type II toxin-antitoxin system RelE/ParE family toxin [Candidatus Nomurabacteria bacterium]
MPTKIERHDKVDFDIRKAVDYYGNFSPLTARKFQNRLYTAVNFLEDFPEGAPYFPWTGKLIYRYKKIKGFPYAAYYKYEKTSNTVFVLAVANTRQNPSKLGRLIGFRAKD